MILTQSSVISLNHGRIKARLWRSPRKSHENDTIQLIVARSWRDCGKIVARLILTEIDHDKKTIAPTV